MKKLGAILLSLVFLLSALFAYPKPWNDAMHAMDSKVHFHLPYLPEIAYKLGLDLQGGAHLVYEADMSAIVDNERVDALSGVRDVVERRVNAFGVSEPVVETTIQDGKYRVIVDLPGVTDVADAVKQIGETPVLEFKLPDPNAAANAKPTEEEQKKIDADQAAQRAAALEILDSARAKGADFAALAKENSIDTATKDNGGNLGFINSDDAEYGGFVDEIVSKRLKFGVANGLYEGTSRIHIMDYLSNKQVVEPKVAHILVCYAGAPGCQSSRTKEEAKTLIDSLKADATKDNFADLAKQNSDDGSKTDGGELGYITAGETVKQFEDAAYALKNGEISEVIETQYGYHIIYRESSRKENYYELAHIELSWTTASDVVKVDPWINTELSGKDIQHASVAFDQNTGAPYIVLQFNAEGADLFGQLTASNVGKVIGIFLDGQPVTTPTVQEAIYGGKASITGQYTLAEAKTTAERLNAGALPVPISVISQQTIGPELGSSSLAKSIYAGLVGFVLVALFMLLYYRLPGFFAVLALCFYAALNLALYKVFGVTMTLSGIAGFVFSFGIAVDANVLVFERLKEELWSGRDLPSAVEEAFRRAWPSIRDGNITTLIATAVLYSMSTGFIRGFALTLTIGVLVSIFSSMVVTRKFMRAIVKVKRLRKPIFYRGMKKS